MERYTQQIVAQPPIKPQRKIVQIVLSILFGTRPIYTTQIQQHWIRHGVYRYQPFDHNKQSSSSLFPYQTPYISRSVHELKFYNQRIYARCFGELLSEYLVELLADYSLMYHIKYPLLCYVPSHPRRLRERGYEPNRLVLQYACNSGLGAWVSFRPGLLRKIRHTHRQSHISKRDQRLSNPRGAFALAPGVDIQNQDIILFDDVTTTGATISECIRVLQDSGARRIISVTLTH